MIISLICAAAQNGVIGIDNRLPWRLPADMKRFRNLTMGHHVLMGRKTYESIGKPLSGRTNIIITRQRDYQAEGCLIVSSLEAAIELCQGAVEIFIAGGASIYQQALARANRIYLTIIYEEFDGDTFLFDIDQTIWQEISREDFEPDAKNEFRYSFVTLEQAKKGIEPK